MELAGWSDTRTVRGIFYRRAKVIQSHFTYWLLLG